MNYFPKPTTSPPMDTLLTIATFTANQGFNVNPFLSASKAFRNDELLWDAAKDFQGPEGYTRLMWASMRGHIGRVRWLLARGAKVNIQADRGDTALHLACKHGRKDIVKMLIAAGADVKKPQDILISTFMGYESIVKDLIAAGADVNAKDWDNHTPLMQASESAHHGIMRLLIAAGAYVNASTSYGRTPIMFAASRYAETVRILLEAGADVNAVSRSRTTALSYATEECKKEIEAFLKK